MRTSIIPILLALLTGGLSTRAQVVNLDTTVAGTAVQFKSDKAEYSGDLKLVTLRGNVVIQRGQEVLNADEVTYNQETKDATANGNVRFQNGTERWQGESLQYNFDTRVGNFGMINLSRDPINVVSGRSQQLGPNHFRLEDVTITTCDPNNMEAWLSASRADVYDKRIIKARNAVFYLEGIPLLYLPAYTVDLDREPTHLDVLPGYSGRNGAYLLNAYTVPLGEENDIRFITHLDGRQERGLAFGQDFTWKDLPDRQYEGLVTGYYAQDDKPYRDANDEKRKRALNIDKDEERYRMRLHHTQSLENGDYLYAEAGYLSDPEVVQDFFDDEFRVAPEQENRLSYSHTDSHFSAGLELSHQLNSDFYDSLNRQPEAFFNFNRVRLPGTELYYESQTSASVLERTFSERNRTKGLEDYDTQRIHTAHTLFYPTKQFGFLNLTPRAGYAGTYYGDTLERTTRTDVKTNTSPDGVVTFTTNRVNVVNNTGADLRNLFELGLETSFKAFKVLHEDPLTNDGIGLRHVVEPFANFTFVPEPDVLPANLYQFDSIDKLDRQNMVRFGVRNKLQTKMERQQGTEVVDLIDLNVYTTYRLDPDEDEESLSEVVTDTEIRLNDWMSARFDNRYNVDDSEFSQINSRLYFRGEDQSYLSIDHRYRPDTRNLFQLSYGLWPGDRFSFTGLTRYDFETSKLEEQQLLFSWKKSCVGYGLGGKWIAGDFAVDSAFTGDDDYQIFGQVWLTAFPRSRLDIGR